ncbi:MAG: nucleotidyltransferase domain-containing protein [Phycisphaerales bacterium]|nr:nucleotidyltransferase domain-containing protein [Phycisphaerales bacterium]
MSRGPELPIERLAEFCRRWNIVELALFGSSLRDDFRTDGSDPSDVDLLVTYAPGAGITLLDEVRMERELAEMLGRPVDLLSRRAVEASHNPFRRNAILSTAKVVYAA